MQQQPCYLTPELHGRVRRGHSVHFKPKSVKRSIIKQSEAKVTRRGNSSPDSVKISDKPEKVLFCDDLGNLDHLDNLGGVNIKPGESEKFWSQLLGQENLTSSEVAERDYKICLGHPDSKINKSARRCNNMVCNTMVCKMMACNMVVCNMIIYSMMVCKLVVFNIVICKVYNVKIPAASNDNLKVDKIPINILNGGILSTNQPINTLNGGILSTNQPTSLSTYQPIKTLNGGKSSVVSR